MKLRRTPKKTKEVLWGIFCEILVVLERANQLEIQKKY
jgi:hypothetical protein